MSTIKVAIIGASGYTGSELVRLLLLHPGVELVAVTSRSNVGTPLSTLYPRLAGIPGADLAFVDAEMDAVVASGARFAFLALPHGTAAAYAIKLLAAGIRVIDLSADFRLNDASVYEEFYGEAHPAPALLDEAVFGLPEVRPDAIREARLIASPGCYPTSIILPLLPLLRDGLIEPDTIVANSTSGVSGAGKKADLTLLYVECNESVRAYGLPKHRHLSEIEQELSIAAGAPVAISFIPHLTPVNAGIHTTTTARLIGSIAQVTRALEASYSHQPFVRLLGPGTYPDTKNVTRTNFIDIGWHHDARTNRLMLLSAEDNLGKGAGSQAIQSMNLMAGFPETAGLQTV